MNRIYIRDLALRCIIGIYPEERENVQDVVLNVVLNCDFGRAPQTDAIADTVDYKGLKKRIVALVEASSFNLIETMAYEVAGICVEDEKVREATVTVDKPGALRFARSVAVELTRTR